MSDMLFVIPIMMMANRIDFTDPTNLNLARTAYVGLEVALLGCCFYVYNSILKAKDKRKIKVPPQAAGFGQEPGPAIEQTVEEYDMARLKQYLQELLVQFVIVLFIHFKWDMAPPLILQTAMNPIRFYKSKLMQAHIFGVADIPRPFPEDPNPLASLMGIQQPQAQEEGTPAPGTIEELPSEPANQPKKPAEKPAKKDTPPKEKDAPVEPKPVRTSVKKSSDLHNDDVPSDMNLID